MYCETECACGGVPGGRMGLHPMAMRMPLDEQGISEILQAEPAQESTEEISISSDEISPSEAAAAVGEASSAVEQPTNGAAPPVKAAASADAAPARERVGCQVLEPAILPLRAVRCVAQCPLCRRRWLDARRRRL